MIYFLHTLMIMMVIGYIHKKFSLPLDVENWTQFSKDATKSYMSHGAIFIFVQKCTFVSKHVSKIIHCTVYSLILKLLSES